MHGDYRLDNLLFGEAGADRPLTVVDWQTVTWGPAITDVAVLPRLRTARRAPPRALRRRCCAPTTPRSAPDAPLTLDDVRDGVRRQSFFGVMMAIVSPMLVERTDRGDQMFMAMLERHCEHVLDTDALAVLPQPRREPLAAQRRRRSRAPPGGEPLWSESWYFDFADAAPGRRRLGASRAGPQPAHRVDQRAAVRPRSADRRRASTSRPPCPTTRPMSAPTTSSSSLDARTAADLPGSAQGRGEAYDDPAALLRGEPGRPIDVAMDLAWTTVGHALPVPDHHALRDPVPVSGTVTADGREYAFIDGVPASATTPGRARTGGAWTGCGAHCTSTTARTCTASTCASPARRR